MACFEPPALKGTKALVDMNQVPIHGRGGLWERLRALRDPRKRRGIRHSQISILAVAICAVLAGARSSAGMGEWARQMSPEQLRRLGCRFREDRRTYLPPSEPTIRRMLQSVDPHELNYIVGRWLAAQSEGEAVAVDGKTLHGARRPEEKRVHLMAALLHKQGVVISQQEVDEGTNEIGAFQLLLHGVDLQDKVATADAMHAQVVRIPAKSIARSERSRSVIPPKSIT